MGRMTLRDEIGARIFKNAKEAVKKFSDVSKPLLSSEKLKIVCLVTAIVEELAVLHEEIQQLREDTHG